MILLLLLGAVVAGYLLLAARPPALPLGAEYWAGVRRQDSAQGPV